MPKPALPVVPEDDDLSRRPIQIDYLRLITFDANLMLVRLWWIEIYGVDCLWTSSINWSVASD